MGDADNFFIQKINHLNIKMLIPPAICLCGQIVCVLLFFLLSAQTFQ